MDVDRIRTIGAVCPALYATPRCPLYNQETLPPTPPTRS